jgi:single-strand DNA-binding protein
MAGNFNKVILMGRLTRDPEVRFTGNNMAIAKIGLAMTRRWKGADGQIKEEPIFVDCDAFGKTAEAMGKYLSKGRPVFIEGHLRLDQWQDKTSGENRSKLKVVIDTFQFVDSKQGAGAGGGASGGGDDMGGGGGGGSGGYDDGDQSPPPPQQRPAGGARVVTRNPTPQPQEVNEDDIPF